MRKLYIIIKSKNVLLILIILFSYVAPALSCSTPVFRYALERWPAYSYIVEVIHDNNLSNSQKQALEMLKTSSESDVPLNLKVIEAPSGNSDDINKSEFPQIRLFFPEENKLKDVIWQGKLTTENVKKIVDSPSRRQLVKNIQRGDAAVWLFLESGNSERDSKQLQVLKTQLNRLSENMKLAESATDVAGNQLDIDIINSGVNFSLIHIKKDDPEEEILARILVGTEVDLKLFKNVPLAFPAFGRGRVLYALAGLGIKDNNIETACNTIIGWCSCTIKDDNPGIDLLVKADWEEVIGDSSWIKKQEVPEVTGLSGFIPEEDDVTEEKVEAEAKAEKESEKIVVAEVLEEKDNIVDESKVNAEPVRENMNVINSNVSEEKQKNSISPVIRNSMIAVVILLIIIASSLFLIKRR